MTFIYILGSFVIGYYIGKRIGVALTMMKMEAIISDLQRIQNSFKQWNEDNL